MWRITKLFKYNNMIERILFNIFIFCFLIFIILSLVCVAINLFGTDLGLIIFGLFACGFVFLFYKTLKRKYE